MSAPTVRSAGPPDTDAVVAVLTQAFAADPVMSWVFADDVRERRLEALWSTMAGAGYLPRGWSTVVPGAAAALWMAPGHRLGDDFWAAHGEELVVGLEGDVDRLGEMSEAMVARHPTDDHWYLLAIGTDPVRQGRGLGASLLAHTLLQADRDRMPAYLEATSARSRVLYERFGFEVLDEFAPPGGPPLWAMWRPPA